MSTIAAYGAWCGMGRDSRRPKCRSKTFAVSRFWRDESAIGDGVLFIGKPLIGDAGGWPLIGFRARAVQAQRELYDARLTPQRSAACAHTLRRTGCEGTTRREHYAARVPRTRPALRPKPSPLRLFPEHGLRCAPSRARCARWAAPEAPRLRTRGRRRAAAGRRACRRRTAPTRRTRRSARLRARKQNDTTTTQQHNNTTRASGLERPASSRARRLGSAARGRCEVWVRSQPHVRVRAREDLVGS